MCGCLTISPVENAVSTVLEDTMASPELLLSCFKHMVKAGTELVSFSFSKTFVMQKKTNHKCQHVPTSWPASNPTKNKCSTQEELEKTKQVTQRAAWPSSPCFWLKAPLSFRGGGPAAGQQRGGLWGQSTSAGACRVCPGGSWHWGALWANRAGWGEDTLGKGARQLMIVSRDGLDNENGNFSRYFLKLSRAGQGELI